MFDLEIHGKKQTKRVVTKILKIDENNQYGHAMTKALPYRCIRKQKRPTLLEFNKILYKISHDDKIGHFFVVDMKFHHKTGKTIFFNETYPPTFEKKNKKVEPFERSTLQLMTVLNRNEEKGAINRFAYNSKTHSILEEKNLFFCKLKTFIF